MDNKKLVNETLDLIKKQRNFKRDSELASFLKISEGALGNIRNRGIRLISKLENLQQLCEAPVLPHAATGNSPSPQDNAPSESLPHPAPGQILEPPSASNLEISRLQAECARLDRLAAGHEGQAKAYRQAHNDLADRVAATLGRCEQLALDLRDSRGKGNRGSAAGKSRP